MKNISQFTLICLTLVLWSCGGGGGDEPTPTPQPTENKAPGTPTLSAPENNIVCIDNVVQFSWTTATDPDGDPVTYDLQIATNNAFSENVQNKQVNTNSTSVSLNKGVAYYWRVKAKDNKNASSNYSTSFNFYTEGEGEINYLPFLPTIVSPALNEIVTEASVTLAWEAEDVDGDPLIFDVYFDATNPPTTMIATGVSEKSIDVTLAPQTNYYWKVVVKENIEKGGQTVGQIWGFKTD